MEDNVQAIRDYSTYDNHALYFELRKMYEDCDKKLIWLYRNRTEVKDYQKSYMQYVNKKAILAVILERWYDGLVKKEE